MSSPVSWGQFWLSAEVGEPAVDPLIEALKDEGMEILWGAASQAIGLIGDPSLLGVGPEEGVILSLGPHPTLWLNGSEWSHNYRGVEEHGLPTTFIGDGSRWRF